jgi:hypothetical protein
VTVGLVVSGIVFVWVPFGGVRIVNQVEHAIVFRFGRALSACPSPA